jgi:CBS-domain-containing membrane protein
VRRAGTATAEGQARTTADNPSKNHDGENLRGTQKESTVAHFFAMSTLRVRDVMSRQVEVVQADAEVEVAQLLKRFRRFHHLPVVDANRRPVGMLTPADLLDYAARPLERKVRVAELMRAPAISVGDFTPLETAARHMHEQHVRALVVVASPREDLAGIVTSTDLLRALSGEAAAPEDLEQVPVDELMTPEPVTASPDTSAADAARLMSETGARHLPVVDSADRVVGMLSERDLIAHLRADVTVWPDAATERLEEEVSVLMTPNPTVLYSGTRAREAFGAFADERLTAVPVVDDGGRLLGILSYVDVLRWLRDRSAAPAEPGPAGAWAIEGP